jgi:hypothetical protein
MEKRKNCWVIPTDKPSRLHEFGNIWFSHKEPTECFRNYNIYITSNDIKEERCWVINSMNKKESVPHSKWGKLIIMTTDQYLIKDGVEQISEDTLLKIVEHINSGKNIESFDEL